MDRVTTKLVRKLQTDSEFKDGLLVPTCIGLGLVILTVSKLVWDITDYFSAGFLTLIGLGLMALYGMYYFVAWLDVKDEDRNR
jgi:hypothetical protein